MKYGLILVASAILAVSCESSMIRGGDINDNDKQLLAGQNEGGAPNQQERDLQSSGSWYPVYSAWERGECSDATPKPDLVSYQTEVLCCNGAFPGQTPPFCLNQTPNPPLGNPTAKPTSSPTSSPTTEFMTDVWYPDYTLQWGDGICVNKSPLPNGRPSYKNFCSCCDMAYAGQTSLKCASDGNCTSITGTSQNVTAPGGVAYYYPQYANLWEHGTCINTPAPPAWRNQVGSSIFIDQQTCCEAIFKGQGGNCLNGAPTSSPVAGMSTTASNLFYPKWATKAENGYCDNDSALQPNDTTLFTTQAACCAAWFNSQSTDGLCLKRTPSFGTLAPTATPVIVWYPKWGHSLSDGVCLNDGKQGNWMTAPYYLFTDATQCCNKHFAPTDNVNPAPFGISKCLEAAGFTNTPTTNPTMNPTKSPTKAPTKNPTKSPTKSPTDNPTKNPVV